MTLDNNLIDGFLLFSLIELFTFLGLLNALRYRKYGKLVRVDANIPEYVYTRNSAIAYLVFIFIFINICAILIMKIWGLVLSVLWITFSGYSLYWFWHTKEDPFRRFHYEQKVWKDPRDKKEKEQN